MRHNGMSYRNDLHLEMEDTLRAQAPLRSKKSPQQWILDERQAMLDAVNRHRALARRTPLTLADVERVENLAVGHSDYTHKFALYCSELVDA